MKYNIKKKIWKPGGRVKEKFGLGIRVKKPRKKIKRIFYEMSLILLLKSLGGAVGFYKSMTLFILTGLCEMCCDDLNN
jgi:hypothetical protein